MNCKAFWFVFLVVILTAGCAPAPLTPAALPVTPTAPATATQTPTAAPPVEATPTFLPETHLSLPSPTPLPSEPRNAPTTWDGAWTNLDPSNFMAQTFRAVSSAIRSVEVNVFAGKGGGDTLTLTILDASRNVLAETSAPVGAEGIDGWLRFEFSEPVPVRPGEEYLLRLRGSKVWVNWKLSGDLYPQGSAIVLGEPSSFEDFIFKVNAAAGEDSNPLTEAAYEQLPAIPPQPGTLDEMIARCPTAEEIAAIDRDIELIFEGGNTGELVCKASEGSADLTAFQKSAYQALLAMKMLTFTRPLPWTDRPLYDWFVSTAKGIRFRDDISQGSCCSPARVINIPSGSFARLSPRETWRWADPRSGWGLVQGNVNLFVHEARHIEKGPHTCGNLDKSLSEMNAYGVTYSLQLWMAYFLSNPAILTAQEPYAEYYRDLALGAAESLRTLAFCETPPPFVP
ncbi:MAG: DUF4082 domain-containing protein [Anaerolineales bacterium]|nr:DUF4082 domain-containing protein [Anaerolineales bacterium]MCX7755833.1 DUF4082 domain-containing protein [Anaerolineales bacterium]MDW8277472.1 hypothetical protein [Anaerolineales bacterium]